MQKQQKLVTLAVCCIGCGGEENEQVAEDWVACDSCDDWWHVRCTEIETSVEDLAANSWYCNNCTS